MLNPDGIINKYEKEYEQLAQESEALFDAKEILKKKYEKLDKKSGLSHAFEEIYYSETKNHGSGLFLIFHYGKWILSLLGIITLFLIIYSMIAFAAYPGAIVFSSIPLLFYCGVTWYIFRKMSLFEQLITYDHHVKIKQLAMYELAIVFFCLLFFVASLSGIYSRLFLEKMPLFG